MHEFPKRPFLDGPLEEWDAERGVTRQSQYAFFDSQRKLDFLAAFAYRLVSRKSSGLSFTLSELIEIYLSICKRFGLPSEDANKVCREIESHTGIIVKATYDTYEFSHKSLQEYLVAEHLIRLRDIPSAITLLRHCPNELAVAVALSSDPTDWFCGLFRHRGSGLEQTRLKPKADWLAVFLSRLAYENPGLEDTPELGGTCLWLFSRCEDAVRDSRIRAFIELKPVEGAIRAFLSYSTVQVNSRVSVEVKEGFEAKYPVVQKIELGREAAKCIPGLRDRLREI
jgi:hypothetical protein